MEKNTIIIIVIIIVVVILCISSSIGAYFYFKSPECDGATCSNLVTLSNWSLASETDTSANLTRTCTKKPDTKTDGCEKISSSILSKSVRWTDTSCNKICGSDGSGNKYVVVDNVTIRSRNTYACNRTDCTSLVNFGQWTLINEDISGGIINRTCTNKPNTIGNVCGTLISETTRRQPWTNDVSCNRPCGNNGTGYKSFTYNNQTFISTNNNYACNRDISCNNLVNFSEWTLTSQDISRGTITRTCANKPTTVGNACQYILNSDLSKTINWTDTSCNRPCGSEGVGSKLFIYDNKTFTSNRTNLPCNRDIDCNTLVTRSNWVKTNETNNNVTITGTCNNIYSNKDACSLLSSTSNTKTVPWSDATRCYTNKSITPNTSMNNKLYIEGDTLFISNNRFNCTPASCQVTDDSLCDSDAFLPFNGTFEEHGNMLSSYTVYCDNNTICNINNCDISKNRCEYIRGITSNTLAIKTNNSNNRNDLNKFSFIYNFTGYNPNDNGLTLSVWLNYSIEPDKEIITLRSSTTASRRITIELLQTNNIKVGIYNSDENSSSITINNSRPNIWFHIAYTIGDNKLIVYYNGTKINERTNSTTLTAINRLYLFRSSWDENQLSNSYPGAIQNLRIYKRKLSDNHIKALYDNKI